MLIHLDLIPVSKFEVFFSVVTYFVVFRLFEPEPNLPEPEPKVRFKVRHFARTEPKVRFRVRKNPSLNRTEPNFGNPTSKATELPDDIRTQILVKLVITANPIEKNNSTTSTEPDQKLKTP